MKIRRTQLRDLDELAQLYKHNYNGIACAETNVQGMITKFNELQNDKNYLFVSAIKDGHLVGFCEGVLNYEIIENQQPVLTLWNVRVLTNERRSGIGEKLMQYAEQFAKENNAVGIFAGCDFENKIGQSFYKKLGYREDFGYFKLIPNNTPENRT